MICDDSLVSLSSGTGAHRPGLNLSAVSVFKWKDTTKRMSNAGNKKNTLTCESKEWINRVWRASAAPLPPPARPAESVACWDRGSACRGSTMAGGCIWDPPLVLVLAGRPSQSAQHSWILTNLPDSGFRTQKHGPRCRLGFCRPDASITPSAWRTDAAAQSSFLQILMRFLFIFSNPLCLNISTACTVYLKCSVSFKSMFYGKSISIRNIVQIL